MNRLRPHAPMLVTLALLHVAVFAKLVFLNPDGVPYATIQWDFAYQYHPWLAYISDCIRSGSWPLWSPYVGAGSPFFLNPQSQLYSPLTILVSLMIGYSQRVAQLQTVFTLLAGGIGVYALSWVLWRNRWAALVSGLCFQFTSAIFSHMQHMTNTNSFAAMPWLFLLTKLAVDDNPRRWARPALAFAIFFFIASGYPGVVLMTLAWLAAWSIFLGGRRGLAPIAIAWLVGIGLAAVQWLPFIAHRALLRRGSGVDLDVALARSQSLSFKELWGALFPFMTVVGFPGTGNDPSLRGLYFGALAIPLAVAAVALARNRVITAVAFACVLALLMACGGDFFLRTALHAALPALNFSRFPSCDSKVMAVLAAAVLAGGGARLLEEDHAAVRALLSRGCAALLAIFAAGWLAFSYIFDKNDFNNVISDAIAAEIFFVLLALFALRWLGGRQRMVVVTGALALELGTCVLVNFAVVGTRTNTADYQKLVASHRAAAPLAEIERPRFDGGFNDFGCGRAFVDKTFCAGDYNAGKLLTLENIVADGYGPFLESGPRVAVLDPGSAPRSFAEFNQSLRPVAHRILEYGVNRVNYQLELERPALVVFNETWFPGWRATVDGADVPLENVVGYFRAIRMNAGQHDVAMKFRPTWFFVGLGVTGLSLLIWIVGVLRLRRRLDGETESIRA